VIDVAPFIVDALRRVHEGRPYRDGPREQPQWRLPAASRTNED
jgi:hypothetical protein